MADRCGQHPPGMCNSPVYTAVDVAKNIRSPQAHKEWIVIMGAAAILKRWEDLGEGVDSNWEQLAQKIRWIQLKSGENTHNQANSEESDGGSPTKRAGDPAIKSVIHVRLHLEGVFAGSLRVTLSEIKELIN